MYYIEKEQNPHNTVNLNCQCYHQVDQPDTPMAFSHHNHEVPEILAVRQGRLSVTVEQQTYALEAGDVLVINPFQTHYGEWESDGDGAYLCLTFSLRRWLAFERSVLREACEALLARRVCFDSLYTGDDARPLFAHCEEIFARFMQKTPEAECAILAENYRLLSRLFQGHCHPTAAPDSAGQNVNFVRRVAAYLEAHYTEPLSTARIAADFFMSTTNFCARFKRYYHTTFTDYLCEYRITRAIERYRQNEFAALADLAAAVGFEEYTYFSRRFKALKGRSPAVYFGKWQKGD